MPFTENANLMRNLYESMDDTAPHSNFHDLTEIVPGLVLEYPGNLQRQVRGDYRLSLDGYHPSHAEMVQAIHDYCQQDERYADCMHRALRGLSTEGLDNINLLDFPFLINHRFLDGSQFNTLLYWLILQEDINYPRNRYMGVRMPLTRYVEAVISARHPGLLPLNVVVANATRRYGRPTPRFTHPELPQAYDETLTSIQNMPTH